MTATRAQRRSIGKRDKRRRFEADLRRIVEFDREGRSPKAISDATQLPASYVNDVIEEFYRYWEERRVDEGEGVRS